MLNPLIILQLIETIMIVVLHDILLLMGVKQGKPLYFTYYFLGEKVAHLNQFIVFITLVGRLCHLDLCIFLFFGNMLL